MEDKRELSFNELLWIRESIFFPFLLDIVAKYRRVPSASPLKMLNDDHFQRLMDLITISMVANRKRLKELGIKVVDKGQREAYLDYEVFYRGYSTEFSFVKDIIKGELRLRLTAYVEQLKRELRAVRSPVFTQI